LKYVLCAALVAALAFPAVSSATLRPFDGTVAGGGIISFDARIQHRKVVRVKNLEWSLVPITCTEGDTLDAAVFTKGIPVEHNHFQAHGLTNNGVVRVSGDFSQRRTHEEGTLRAFGDFSPFTNCDTGRTAQQADAL
jgi:hypothetical protein